MLQYAVAYVATAVVFLGIDFVWLNYAATNVYRPRLGDLLLESPNIAVAGVFYLAYSAAIVVLAVSPALNQSNVWVAIGLGAVLGAAAYGTYDITNLSTLKGWSVTVTGAERDGGGGRLFRRPRHRLALDQRPDPLERQVA